MVIYLENFLNSFCNNELVNYSFVCYENNAVFCNDSYCCAALLDGLLCIFDLQKPAIRTEHCNCAVITHQLVWLWLVVHRDPPYTFEIEPETLAVLKIIFCLLTSVERDNVARNASTNFL